MRPKSRRVEAIVVGRKDLFEADKIITLFTPNEGKIKVIAKGVAKPASRRLGKLELGGKIKALVVAGRSFDIITEVEVLDDLASIRQDMNKLGGLLFLCELINNLLPEQEENQKVWDKTIIAIDNIKNGRISQLVNFEAQLLDLLGFGITKEEENLMNKKDWKNLHLKLNSRLQAIAEKPFKSLAIFK